MPVNLISVKCPDCGASLEIEEGRKQFFCTYCGAKIMLNNENEFIYRHIDEAGIKQAETERIIELKKMELAEKKRLAYEKRKSTKIKLSVLLGILAIVTFGIGFTVDGAFGITIVGSVSAFILIGMWAIDSNINDEEALDGKVKVPSGINDYERKSYVTIEAMLKSAGFTNIRCVPLNDLTTGIIKKPDMVESIIINGNEITSGGRRFSPDASVVISYHSFSSR